MNIQQLLLPFIENIDYKLEAGQIIPLPKVRKVKQIILHPEVAAVTGQENHGIIPATFDANGNELTPMIPAQEFIPSIPYSPAYEEEIEVDETYFENVPSMDSLKLFAIKDMALAVSEFLADKSNLRDEDDSINIVDNNIHSWRFVNIPQPSIDELYNAYNSAISKNNQAEINRQALKYLADTDWYVTRFAETGVAIPAEISTLRAQARAAIL
jgi:hypothetical protein